MDVMELRPHMDSFQGVFSPANSGLGTTTAILQDLSHLTPAYWKKWQSSLSKCQMMPNPEPVNDAQVKQYHSYVPNQAGGTGWFMAREFMKFIKDICQKLPLGRRQQCKDIGLCLPLWEQFTKYQLNPLWVCFGLFGFFIQIAWSKVT